jgi:hypothetical protein
MRPTLGSAASSRNLPRDLARRPRPPQIRRYPRPQHRVRPDRPLLATPPAPLRPAVRRDWPVPLVLVELRRISRDTTDGDLPICEAIARTPHPAFSPVAISARSENVSIIRPSPTSSLQDQQPRVAWTL